MTTPLATREQTEIIFHASEIFSLHEMSTTFLGSNGREKNSREWILNCTDFMSDENFV